MIQVQEKEIPDRNVWQIVPVGPEWIGQFKSFQNSAFRLEVLQAYKEPSEREALSEFNKGNPVSRKYIEDWCALVAAHQMNGRPMSRVHVVDLPLSDYMRFEIECAYSHTSLAGESISLIDRSKIPSEIRDKITEDFWLFDESKVMVQIYDQNGTLLHSKLTTSPTIVAGYIAQRDRLLSASEPFLEFYQRETGQRLRM